MSVSNHQGLTRHSLHDALVQYYDARAATYDTEPATFHLQLAKDLIKWADSYIPNELKSPVKVLDLCCGTGMVSLAALEHFEADTEVHGVDISASSLAIARQKIAVKGVGADRAEFFHGSAAELDVLPLEKGQYALVTCCSALVLLPERLEDILREWGAYLKPGGILIFDVPAEETQFINDYLSRAIAPYGVPTISRDWVRSGESVKQLIIGSGLRVEDMFLTGVYKTVAMQVQDAEGYWEARAAKGLIFDTAGLSTDERERAKQEYLRRINQRADSGVVRDEFRFYVGVARK